MVKEYVKSFYLENDFNCAETMLKAIDAAYGLGLRPKDVKLVGAWGGGAAIRRLLSPRARPTAPARP